MIFVDTGFLFALFVQGDKHHERVKSVFGRYSGRQLDQVLLTTNHVVAETITLLRKRGHSDPDVRHSLAVGVGQQLMAGTLGSVYQATRDDETAALAYLAQHTDQDYSFTDCVSFVVMENQGIREALAVDSDFTHRFIATPGPLPKYQ